MIRKLDLDLVKIAQGVVQDGLLSLTLALTLALSHLLLLLLLLSSLRLLWSEWHQETGLALRLRWLDWTAAKDIARSARSTKRKAWLWLRTCKTWIAQQAIGTMHCTWANSHWLVQMHRLPWLSLVLWRLFQSLTLLLPMLSVLLFLNVDLLNFPHSLAFPLCCRRLSRSLTQCW